MRQHFLPAAPTSLPCSDFPNPAGAFYSAIYAAALSTVPDMKNGLKPSHATKFFVIERKQISNKIGRVPIMRQPCNFIPIFLVNVMIKQDKRPVRSAAGTGVNSSRPAKGYSEQFEEIQDIIAHLRVTALFQPVIDLANGRIFGYNGMIRGPSNSLLHSPLRLFNQAKRLGLYRQLENLCCKLMADRFFELQLPGMLFLTRSSEVFSGNELNSDDFVGIIRQSGLEPKRIAVELTEDSMPNDFDPARMRNLISHYDSLGFQVALDDPGEYLSNLDPRQKSRPVYVKIDRYIIQDIDKNPAKNQFVRSLLEIAARAGCLVIADGIETRTELLIAREMGIPLGQGCYLARPDEKPFPAIAAEAVKANSGLTFASREQGGNTDRVGLVERKLLIKAPFFTADTNNEDVFRVFEKNTHLDAMAVVKDGKAIGMIIRSVLIDRFARPYRRELYGKKPCTKFMDANPLIVDKNITIQDLVYLVAGDRRHLSNGYILTENGYYLGIGTGHDLIREITEMQIQAARYANPLTGLPGNLPIDEHIDELLAGQHPFCVCYCDLDSFKPFNDVYGFSKGDEMIQMTAKILTEICDPELDFLGHIGGDDFIALFRSPNWEERCQQALERFGDAIKPFFSLNDCERGGYVTENRHGKEEFHALTSLSIGAVKVEPGLFNSHMEVSSIAAEAKKKAKKIPGNSLYVNQRRYAE
ncbi:MAG: EAL domain-containing protein [Sulfuricella sp.]